MTSLAFNPSNLTSNPPKAGVIPSNFNSYSRERKISHIIKNMEKSWEKTEKNAQDVKQQFEAYILNLERCLDGRKSSPSSKKDQQIYRPSEKYPYKSSSLESKPRKVNQDSSNKSSFIFTNIISIIKLIGISLFVLQQSYVLRQDLQEEKDMTNFDPDYAAIAFAESAEGLIVYQAVYTPDICKKMHEAILLAKTSGLIQNKVVEIRETINQKIYIIATAALGCIGGLIGWPFLKVAAFTCCAITAIFMLVFYGFPAFSQYQSIGKLQAKLKEIKDLKALEEDAYSQWEKSRSRRFASL